MNTQIGAPKACSDWSILVTVCGAGQLPGSGELVTRRHRFWRWFDFLWMLHIMDYESRENVNNALLRVATGVGVTLALSGLWLVYFRFLRRAPSP
jgi:hypothetical protein